MRVLLALIFAISWVSTSSLADDVVLGASRVSAVSVTLTWTGGSPLFQVYRSGAAAGLVSPSNILTQTSSSPYDDTAAVGDILFYEVTAGHCASAVDCPASGSECRVATCTSGDCGFSNLPVGTAVTTQTSGDCHTNRCDGLGNVVSNVDDSDLPNDGNPCTMDACQNGVPINAPVPDGVSCDLDGGTRCESGACVPTVVVVRVGDGAAALSTAAAPVFLEERTTGGSIVSTVSFPIAVNGAQQPCTLGGTVTSEGGLARSSSENVVVLAAYSASPGVASVSTTTASSVNRVVCSVDFEGNVDSTTRLGSAFSGASVRAATSVDGTSYWASGTSSATSGGAWYISRGATSGTQILTTPNNTRWIGMASGQLYGSSSSGTFTNVFTIGTGLPTTAGQTATSFPGMPTSGGSPYGFALFDLNPNVAGLDTLYVGDDRAVASGGGVQKWTFDGVVWTLVTTFRSGITTGVRGLTGYVASNGNIVLVATTNETNANTLVRFIDDFINLAPPATVLATSPINTAYRGVAMAPH